MATLQVKHLSDDLHAALQRRAKAEGLTLTDLVTRMLQRELALPSMGEWLADLHRDGFSGQADVLRALDDDRDGQ